MDRRYSFWSALILTGVFVFSFQSCVNPDWDEDDTTMTVASCEGCHINYAHLQEVYSPDTGAPVGGCGGEAPHYEPYDRVYLGGEGYEAFKASGHYKVGCVGCHNGKDGTDDKNLAHSGDFIKHPSLFHQEKCASCHQGISDDFMTSIHNGFGQMRKVAIRSGLSGAMDFDQLPAHQIKGYNANCATCHGTCGNCHIVRPPIAGGGLSHGHNFVKSPDMLNVCVACHVSRGGHAYLGVASGTQPDVHLKKAGYKCMDCHSGSELHGNGQFVEERYAYSELPTCVECHVTTVGSNVYHTTHWGDFNCQVCHSQDYNNCGSCHIHGDGARIPAYIDYKIAVNPLPLLKTYKFALVRRTLGAPDNWEKYGVAQYANFAALPTYNFTTPHNILRWTERTTVDAGSSCSANCHIRKEGDSLVNTDLYLFQSDLLLWEFAATSGITVDGKLPSSWFSK